MNDDTYKTNLLRRWSVDTSGQFGCYEDAVNVSLVSDDDLTLIEMRNAALHLAEAAVMALEAGDVTQTGATVVALAELRAGDASKFSVIAALWPPLVITIRPYFDPLSPDQFLGALRASGWETEVKTYFDTMAVSDPVMAAFASAKYEKATYYERYNPLILAVQAQLNIPDEQMNTLWLWAMNV